MSTVIALTVVNVACAVVSGVVIVRAWRRSRRFSALAELRRLENKIQEEA